MGRAAGNLHPDRTRFIGRQRDVAGVLGELERGTRLLTITGPSGMGKTRLARQVARDSSPRFPGGAWFIHLAACRTASDLQAAVANLLGLHQPPGEALAAALASFGPLLLVLDNAESMAPETARIIEGWLDHCPEIQLLVTSLVPLGIQGESRLELLPLEGEDAIALYFDRARMAWADRNFTAPEQQVIGELVQRLDRLPLAIELAAARIRILPPRELLARVSERLELLQTNDPGAHGSLFRALSLSWNFLDEAERWALARASVFVGGFTLEAAEEILGSTSGDRRALDLLDGLRGKALVQLDPSSPPRFSLYESVRDFAAFRLREFGGEAEARRRHAEFFLRCGELHAAASNGPEAPAAIRWLLAERENLIAVHRRSLAGDPAAAARAGLALAVVLAQQGPPAFEKEILDGTVAAARRVEDPSVLARTLWVRARACKRLGDPAGARVDLDEGLGWARAAGDRIREGHLLAESGAIRTAAADLAGARGELVRALAIAREERDELLEGVASMILGVIDENGGAHEASGVQFEAALAIFRRVGHLRYQGVALLNLGGIRSHQGRFSPARQALDEARGIFRLLENPASEAYALMNLGSLALTSGALGTAEQELLDVLAIERRCGNRLLRGLAIGSLGLVALERGETREAEARLSEGMAILRGLGAQRYAATLQPFRAAALAILGRLEEARLDLAEAHTAFESMSDRRSLQSFPLLEGILELAEARGLAEAEAHALEQRARERLHAARVAPEATVESFFLARRLLERALENRAPAVAADEGRCFAGLSVGPDTAFFEIAGGGRVDLRRRTAIRRILRGLVENRLVAPGVGLGPEELARIGWPGEKILPDAAAARVWSGIRTLRSLGLADALRRHADGYLLDSELPVLRAQD